ncbi:MAG: single-stranded-DNA-specific exonuclease RecJ [Gemmatimonadota bacterium]|nr:MAG: single-stranded-DNA-specific exonuclease RecJ [Gemmatimonadota bacterium]
MPVWHLPEAPDSAAVDALADALSLPPALCALLITRGITEPDEAKRFLRPPLEHTKAHESMAGVAQATARLVRAIDAGETILVHGDYDVDGVCGAALYTLWFRRLGGTVVPFVPHRTRDGYDFGPAGLAAAQAAGATLVVTVDSGIQANAAVDEAARSGIDVIVTDHHTVGDSLPRAVAVVNPHQLGCEYPFRHLCGTGVAYRLCEALGEAFDIPSDEIQAHLDLVALATVADLVPLTGENRTFVRVGLRTIEHSDKLGLRALVERAELSGRRLDAGDVGFRLAPRINAAGRMEDAMSALRLLLTCDPGEAEALAGILDDANRRRRKEERRMVDQVMEQLSAGFRPEEDYGLVLAGEGWHPGVIGIVASRVVERVHRPTVLVALDGQEGRGSGRSIPGFNIFEAVQACREHLGRFGGHPQAAGMDVARDSIAAFREAFNAQARSRLEGETLRPAISPEVEIELEEATLELAHYLPYMGPFGMGNRAPLFVARGVHLDGRAKVVGSNHLRVSLEQGGARLSGIGFGLADRIEPESLSDGPVDAVFQLREDHYRGVTRVDARFRDIRPSEVA